MDWLNNPPWLVRIYDIPSCRVLMFAVGTIGLATLSWFCFEKPINNLKQKFPYPVTEDLDK